MIKTRRDLHFFLDEDRKRNSIPTVWGGYFLRLLAGRENAKAFRYLKCLRKCEYHLNNSRNWLHKLMYYYYSFRLSKIGSKYHISILPNTIGYGVRILHLSGGGGILLNIKQGGNYCAFNAGVLLGNKGSQENRPILGNHVAFAPGAKAFGKITIGNNVFVAPNAVVTKDVPDNCVVGGIPAKIIKQREPLTERIDK